MLSKHIYLYYNLCDKYKMYIQIMLLFFYENTWKTDDAQIEV